LAGGFVGAPSDETGPVPETIARDVVVPHLSHESRLERLPFAATFGAPAARTSRRLAGESGCAAQLFELPRQPWPFSCRNTGRETDVMEPALRVIEPEEQRTDFALPGGI